MLNKPLELRMDLRAGESNVSAIITATSAGDMGAKQALRQLATRLQLTTAACATKKAIQFGSGFVKQAKTSKRHGHEQLD